jgi:ABC-type branched-subunit amino acid transport system ATPase component/branched-subunit amino acid ABC-type transport system permease component
VDKFLNLTISGLVTGAIYSIMASGLVLTYTTSGIFNFAHGAVAFTTAYLFYQLNTGLGVPIVPAMIISVFIFAPVLGLLLDRVLLRRLAKAPVYARIVGTIGLLVALPALTQWIVDTLMVNVIGWDLPGSEAVVQGVPVPGIGPTPPHVYHPLSGVTLTSDKLAVFIVAGIAAILLWLVLRHSRVGLEMRAVVDRDTLAGLRGVNAARTSSVAWVLTMILAGLGGVLIAPLFILQDTFYALVVLGSLAAVVLGGLRSIPIAFAGGLALGVIQNLVAGYRGDVLPSWINEINGLQFSVPYILVIVLLLFFGRDRSRQGGTVAEDTPRPDHREGLPRWRRLLPWTIFIVALIAYSQAWINVSWLQADSFDQSVVAQSLVMGIIFLSFVVVTGLGGMVSLAQAAFVTAGGFAAGWALTWQTGMNIPGISTNGQINFLWAALFGALVAAALGALIAMLATRLGGVMLALGTLAAAFICASVVFEIDDVRNHSDLGWTIRSPTLDVPGLNWVNDVVVKGDQPKIDFSQIPEQILLFLAVFGIITLVIHALYRSSSGRAMLATRSSEVAAQASGVRVNRMKIMVFALSAGIAGFGGVMLGLFNFSIGGANPSYALVYTGLFWLALAVTFGIRRPGGALLGGFAFAAGTAIFHWFASDVLPGIFDWFGVELGDDVNTLLTSVYFIPILSGLAAINLAQEPDGILSLVGQQRLAKQREKRRQERVAAAEATAHEGAVPEHELVHATPDALGAGLSGNGDRLEGATFSMRGIVAGYGDAEVLHGVDLRLDAGRVTALLGANGAGKSTLCAVAAGLVEATLGTVRLEGRDITGESSYRRARDGLLLVPEARGIFPGLTVEENLTVLLRDAGLRTKAYERFPILAERRKQVAGLLSGGEQQMLSLAPALADPPKALIADEPTLGLAPLAAEAVMRAIVELRDAGSAVLLVEEHAQNALSVADTLVFMELGTVVWSGPRADADMEMLTSAYLGSSA